MVYAQAVKSFDSSEEIGNIFLSNIIDGIDAFDIPGAIAAVDFEKAQLLMKKMFKREYCTVSVIKPRQAERE